MIRCWIFSLLFISSMANAQDYAISWVKASPEVQSMDGGKVLLPRRLPLKNSIKVQTRTNSDLILWDSKKAQMFVHPDTTLELKLTGSLSSHQIEVYLINGSVSFSLDQSTIPIMLVTNLGNFLIAQGNIDVGYDLQKVRMDFKSYTGTYELKINDAEDGRTLLGGHSISYIGERNEDGIVFNYLLGGKKVAQGKWTPVKKLNKKEIAENGKIWSAIISPPKKAAKGPLHPLLDGTNPEGNTIPVKREAPLCLKPRGELHDCLWTCINNPKSEKKNCRTDKAGVYCERRRCFADGEWKEPIKLDAGEGQIRCKPRPLVGACN
ncbi:MAG: hypothetical protein V4736_13470 [Bdellovibrionota bacterium]